MYLLYADESGHVADPNQQYFVLAGFAVFERQSWWFANEMDDIAVRFNPADPNSIELRGNPMLQGRGSWRSFSVSNRLQAISDSLQLLATSNPSNRIFASVVRKSVSPKDPVEYCFEQLASRFDQYLMRLHRMGDTQRGIIILDRSTYESSLQALATHFRTIGHQWGVLRNFSEVPLFLDSKASRLTQLADLVAYSLFRKFEKGDNRFYEIIENRFDSEGGVVHGLHTRI